MKGKDLIIDLSDSLSNLIEQSEWSPSDVSSNTIINFIEVKAMLINARNKLKSIAVKEGYTDKKISKGNVGHNLDV
jgi:hypothetical protein